MANNSIDMGANSFAQDKLTFWQDKSSEIVNVKISYV